MSEYRDMMNAASDRVLVDGVRDVYTVDAVCDRLIKRSSELNHVRYRLARALGYEDVDGKIDTGLTLDEMLDCVDNWIEP